MEVSAVLDILEYSGAEGSSRKHRSLSPFATMNVANFDFWFAAQFALSYFFHATDTFIAFFLKFEADHRLEKTY